MLYVSLELCACAQLVDHPGFEVDALAPTRVHVMGLVLVALHKYISSPDTGSAEREYRGLPAGIDQGTTHPPPLPDGVKVSWS